MDITHRKRELGKHYMRVIVSADWEGGTRFVRLFAGHGLGLPGGGMGPDRFNLRALERHVFRSVDELVDDCFPLRHKESLERLVAREFELQREFGLKQVEVEMFHQNFVRIVGQYHFEDLDRRGKRVVYDAKVVIEGLYVFSPRNWSFRLDVVHMHAELAGRDDDGGLVEELLARWKRFPLEGRFKYRKGVFYLALTPLPELQESALGGCA